MLLAALAADNLKAQSPPAATNSQPPPPTTEVDSRLPEVDFYFPEGELDFRLNGLIKNAFYEGQLRYNFPKGDITAFLRYRYYGFRTIYQIGVFDSLEFEALEKLDNDFQRVRGSLLLLQWPHSFHHRTSFLLELDRITSNKEEFRFSTNRTNTFLRLGYQIGTPDDDRSNAIVGETRASIRQLLTAHRKIGPRGFGWTGALTYGFDWSGGDFEYVKAEFEGLKRFELKNHMLIVARLHGGSFLDKQTVREGADIEAIDSFSIPRNEFFALDGRDNLRGLQQGLRGTEELHTTMEWFLPWFVEDQRDAIGVQWNNWYWILYGGYGTIGFDRHIYSDSNSYILDLGLGFEGSFRLKKRDFFVSAILAHAVDQGDDVEARLSIKSVH